WPLERWPTGKFEFRRLTASPFIEKLPLLALSAGARLVTVAVQKVTVDYSNHLPLTTRLVNALSSYFIYLAQFFWPTKLSVLYSYSADQSSVIEVTMSLLIIVAVTAIAFTLRKKAPYLLVGWAWYLVTLLPVIGLIQVGMQPHADRYTYLPEIGIAISVAWALTDLLSRVEYGRQALAGLLALVLGLLGWRASIQASYWKDTSTLWAHVLTVAPENDVANYNIAELLRAENRLDEAIAHYQKALINSNPNRNNHIELNPAILHNALGNALLDAGRLNDALAQYRQAIASDPNFADAHSNLAIMLARRGELAQAIDESQKALAIPPEDAVSHVRLAILLMQSGRADLALPHYRRALEIDPGSVDARRGLDQCTSATAAVTN
ncbi:MAG TPA: tetratricopeptide repeat protein, partial [Terriglobales bacterium]|nr:tetratricopeptide repeat protein [Terriglobales bacterium]